MGKVDADQRRTLEEQRWRVKPSLYAERMSEGAWLRYRWVEYILEYIRERVIAGSARIIINSHPRSGKSEATSHWLPAWYLDLYPDRRVILASYGDRFATKWGRKVRDHLDAHPNSTVEISKEHGAASDWATTKGGGMLSVGVGGSVTGEGGDLLLVEDITKNWEEACSLVYQRRTIDWFDSTYYTRKEPGASIIVNQTRWGERDLCGYLLKEHPDNWEHICLPALAEEDDPLGRQPGEALCPERFPVEALEQIKAAMSSYMFAGLYQQRPAPLEGGIVKRDWFQRYSELPGSFDELVQSWDLTFKALGTSYVVGEVWGRKAADFFLVDLVRDRLDFPSTLRAIERLTHRWPGAATKIVEEAANGHAAIAMLQDKIPGIVGQRPQGSKEARLVAVSGLIEAGNVWIPEQSVAEWADDFVEECVNFPNAANDDQVDSMTMALSRLSKRTQNFNIAIPTSGSRPSPWSFDNA